MCHALTDEDIARASRQHMQYMRAHNVSPFDPLMVLIKNLVIGTTDARQEVLYFLDAQTSPSVLDVLLCPACKGNGGLETDVDELSTCGLCFGSGLAMPA